MKRGTLIKRDFLLLRPRDVEIIGGGGGGRQRLPAGVEDPALAYERLLCSMLDLEDTTGQTSDANAAVPT